MSEFTITFHQLTTSVIPQLTAFLQLRYHANDQRQTPFATHPTTMFVAVSSFVVYYLIHVVLLRSPASSFAFAQHFVFSSGYAVVSTLTAAVFPDRASPFLYVIFGLLSAGRTKFRHDRHLQEKSVVGRSCQQREHLSEDDFESEPGSC